MFVFGWAYEAMDALGGMSDTALWALMLGGLALVGLTVRRRNRTAIVYA
jgi:hypothetical protein